MQELHELDPLPLESKVRTLKVERHLAVKQQSMSSYLLPVGEVTEDILSDLNDRIAIYQASM